MYPEGMVAPMRQELTAGGIDEARTAADVENAINQKGTLMVVVNSICGCAAGRMRPGVRAAIQSGVRPDRMITVFAGQDREATDAARRHFTGFPPSSPSIGLATPRWSNCSTATCDVARRNVTVNRRLQIGSDLPWDG